MTIGDVRIQPPLVLAPMAGITTSSFRMLVKECGGCGLVWTQLISANAVVSGSRKADALMRFTQAERPIAFQVFGGDPERVAEAAKLLLEHEPDIIDINMGCPVRKVVKTGAGAALLGDPVRAQEIVRATVRAVDVPVTVKLRSPAGAQRGFLPQFARELEMAGAAAICVHARTPAQKHTGATRWDDIRAVKEAVTVPVIGNGGVREAADAVRMMRETGCDAVMVGSSARADPWIFSRIAALLAGHPEPPKPTVQQRLAMALRHAKALSQEKGERTAMREMRLHAHAYVRGLPGAKQVRERLNNVVTLSELEQVLAWAAELAGVGAGVGGTGV